MVTQAPLCRCRGLVAFGRSAISKSVRFQPVFWAPSPVKMILSSDACQHPAFWLLLLAKILAGPKINSVPHVPDRDLA